MTKLVSTEKLPCTGFGTYRAGLEKMALDLKPVDVVVKCFSDGHSRVLCPYAKLLPGTGSLHYCPGVERLHLSSKEWLQHPIDNICVYESSG